MRPERLRATLQFGVLALLLLAPLPFGSVQPGFVLSIELSAGILGLGTILLFSRDEGARASLPAISVTICAGVIALGIFQVLPLPFRIAEKFNPTAELLRPLIPYLGLEHPPSVSWSLARPESTDALLRFVAYVLIGLVAAVSFDTERARRRFAFVLVTSAVFQAVYGSGEYLTGRQHIFGFAKKYYLDSATGTFVNRNHFATLLAMALPFALTLSFPANSRRKRVEVSWRERVVAAANGGGLGGVLAVGASAAIWTGLFLSNSRGGLTSGIVGAAIVLVRFRGNRAARLSGAIGVVVLLVLLSAELGQAPGERLLTLKEDIKANGGRVTVWRDAMGLIASRPIVGWGFGTFESVFPMVQSEGIEQTYDHAHNDWLEWSIEGGLITVFAAMALLVLALAPARRGAAAEQGSNAAFAVASRAAIIAVALHALWDFSLRIPAVALAGAAVLGMGLGLGRTAERTLAGFVFQAKHGTLIDSRAVPGFAVDRRGLAFLKLAPLLTLFVIAYLMIAITLFHRRAAIQSRFGFAAAARGLALGPNTKSGLAYVDEQLRRAMKGLETPATFSGALRQFREALEVSERVLTSIVISHPADCRAIQNLAAVKFELATIHGTNAHENTRALVHLAATRSPRSAESQLDLAGTLFRVGEKGAAIERASAAVRLRPDDATRAVSLMIDFGVELDRIVDSLPREPEVLVALKGPFLVSRRGTDYLDIVETWNGEWTTDLVSSFGDACLSLYQPRRLAKGLSRLARLRMPKAEAQRQHLLGWAAFSEGDFEGACRFAASACNLLPDEPAYVEFLGDCERERGHGTQAVTAFQAAIATSAVRQWSPSQRARLYRKLGQAYESIPAGDLAYDAYRRAQELDPSEQLSADRLRYFTGSK